MPGQKIGYRRLTPLHENMQERERSNEDPNNTLPAEHVALRGTQYLPENASSAAAPSRELHTVCRAANEGLPEMAGTVVHASILSQRRRKKLNPQKNTAFCIHQT